MDIFADLKWRGLIHQSTDESHLQQWLQAGPRTVYAGFDPTADMGSVQAPPGDLPFDASAPTLMGKSWNSEPPSATLISCMPRQMPSTGFPASMNSCSNSSS